MEKTYQLERLTCPSCAQKIESVVKKAKGVNDVEVLFMSSKVKIIYNEKIIDDVIIQSRIEKLGYKVLSEN